MAHVLESVVKVCVLIGLVFITFGYSYSYLLLDLYGGRLLSDGTGWSQLMDFYKFLNQPGCYLLNKIVPTTLSLWRGNFRILLKLSGPSPLLSIILGVKQRIQQTLLLAVTYATVSLSRNKKEIVQPVKLRVLAK